MWVAESQIHQQYLCIRVVCNVFAQHKWGFSHKGMMDQAKKRSSKQAIHQANRFHC